MLPFILFLFQLIGASLGGSTTGKPLARTKVIRSSGIPLIWGGHQVKSPRLLDSGTPEARSSLVKTKVKLVKIRFLNGQLQVFVRKGKGPTWASASTYPAYLAGQAETGGERKIDQVRACSTLGTVG